MELTEHERKVLGKLASAYDEGCWGFAAIAYDTKLNRNEVRDACRSLRGKGLARYERALWTEDGEMAGSGYGLTREGNKVAQDHGIFLCSTCDAVFVEGPNTCPACDAWWQDMKARAAAAQPVS